MVYFYIVFILRESHSYIRILIHGNFDTYALPTLSPETYPNTHLLQLQFFFVTHHIQLVLPMYAQAYGHSPEHGQPTGGHILEGK